MRIKSFSTKRILAIAAIAVLLLLALHITELLFPTEYAEAATGSEYADWNAVADEMDKVCDDAYRLYTGGDAVAAKKRIDDAYFKFYEKLGFEKRVMSYISGDRAAKVEYQFAEIKKSMTRGDSNSTVKAAINELKVMIREDANRLDGKKESSGGTFVASLLIIVREGVEAILIVGAIIAYLKKMDAKGGKKVYAVYAGSGAAILASVIMAIILYFVSALSGVNQEITEGITMLIAVAVLFYVSNWMFSKADALAWEGFIKGKVKNALTKGSVFSLAFAAFLAVFREGAEVILFYGALIADTQTTHAMIWVGLAVGIVILVVIFLLIKLLSVKIPLKPFFIGTSVLMFLMSISFVGAGVKELQEGNVISVTPISGMSSVDILGIYPTLETFIPQMIMLAVAVLSIVLQILRWKRLHKRKAAEDAESTNAEQNGAEVSEDGATSDAESGESFVGETDGAPTASLSADGQPEA
ncbi:MAG: FTR1 family iron permease [Clostridiaceae bacterium]|jgi:high-affinity iron transporter|nr:FTR1 family iron permease [Clostridiaceae bacterium]